MSSLLATLAENIRENGRLVGRVGHHMVSQAKHWRGLHHASPKCGQSPGIHTLLTITLTSFVFPADTKLHLKTSYTDFADRQVQLQNVQNVDGNLLGTLTANTALGSVCPELQISL